MVNLVVARSHINFKLECPDLLIYTYCIFRILNYYDIGYRMAASEKMRLKANVSYGSATESDYIDLKMVGSEDNVADQKLTCQFDPPKVRPSSNKDLLVKITSCLRTNGFTTNESDLSDKETFLVKLRQALTAFPPELMEDQRIIADHFSQRIHEFADIKEALTHPLFWTSSEKIMHFKKCASKHGCTSKICCNEQSGNCFLGEENGCSWKGKLTIDWGQLEDICFSPNGNENVEESTIKRLADVSYNDCYLEQFLQFFGDIHATFWQQSDEVRRCFNDDTEDGYWKFFSQKFPGLFISVYDEFLVNV